MSTVRTISKWLRSSPSPESHIFVTGAPRSGTSLLKILLVAHSGLAGTNRESTGLFRFRDFSRPNIAELDSGRWYRLMGESSGLPQLFDAVADEFVRDQNASRFVDKVNVTRWRLGYLLRFFPNAKFVNIIRDGRDSFCSAKHHPSVHQASDLGKYASYWDRCVRLAEKMIPDDRVAHIRYEDLVNNPPGVIPNLMQFLDIQFEATQVKVEHYSSVSSLKARRVHKNLAKPINSSSVGRWKNDLSEQEAKSFAKIAGNSLRHWRYEV